MNVLERALIEKAGNEHGWELVVQSDEGGVVLSSARHSACISISEAEGGKGWSIAGLSALIGQEIYRTFPEDRSPEGDFIASDTDKLGQLLLRAAELAQSLPNQAALTYTRRVQHELVHMDLATEAERMVKQRIGQDTFRKALMDYWGRACAVTGVDLPEVLRASHAKPWAQCESDEERLDVFNGFLLCAHLDALFDRGLITFDSKGCLICSARLTPGQREVLNVTDDLSLRWVAPEHAPYLAWHCDHVFVAEK
ncbi:MAG: HNH endonuclease [Pseudomonadota bacterium]|nr:HNH endonuclease [Pseudomonadota bacterium]